MRAEQKDSQQKKRYKRILFIAVIALLFGVVSYSFAQDALDTSNSFLIVVNNTNLAPTFPGEPTGTGERLNNTKYYTNTSPIELFVWAHANAINQNARVILNINGTNISETSGRPLGGAEESAKQITAIIPKFSNYTVYIDNIHHYEWREYAVLSGKNGTLSINQTIIGNGTNNHSNLTNLNWSVANHTLDTDLNFTKNDLGMNGLGKNGSVKFSDTAGDNSIVISTKDNDKPSSSFIGNHDSYNQFIVGVNGVTSIFTQNQNLFNFTKNIEIDTQANSTNSSACFTPSGVIYRCGVSLNHSSNYSNLTNVPNMTLSNQSNIYAIYGGLNADGTRRIGAGYTSNHNSTGHYFILFNSSYSAVPTVLLTVHSTVANAFNGISVDDNGCGITKTYVCVVTATPTSSAYVDVKFEFSVFGEG